jgi:transposase
MAKERLSMRKVREVLRLKWEQGLSNRDISVSCLLSASTVFEYVHRARAVGLHWPLDPSVTDEQLERRLFPPPLSPQEAARVTPDWSEVSRQLARKGVTLQLLWEEYRAVHPDGYGYSRYCDLFRTYRAAAEPRMRQTHKAGEKLFVDYAGQTVPIIDRATGEVREAQVFVATLGASGHTYVEATATQSSPDWIGAHVRAFAFFGGVPQVLVPDNLKSGVTSPCFYEPDLNPTYHELARHYGVAVIPARVRKPRDKAKVESHVQIVERRILAPLRDRRFFSLEECNEAIAPLLDALNERPFQKLAGSRRELFLTIDAPALRPLPADPYVYAEWKKARVGIDYHVQVDHSFYSVPYALLKQEVHVCLTARVVEIFHKGERVASHARSARSGRHVTLDAHMPPAHRAYGDWSPERLVRWAGQAGGHTQQVVEQILASRIHPQQGFRSCLGIMRLGKEYGQDRLEAACRRAAALGAASYRSIASILKNNLDTVPLERPEPDRPAPLHQNIRGASYYAPDRVPTPDYYQSSIRFEKGN